MPYNILFLDHIWIRIRSKPLYIINVIIGYTFEGPKLDVYRFFMWTKQTDTSSNEMISQIYQKACKTTAAWNIKHLGYFIYVSNVSFKLIHSRQKTLEFIRNLMTEHYNVHNFQNIVISQPTL